MTMSQCSSLPISPAVITQTHMELSITRLLHTGTHPPSRESERDGETAAENEGFQQLALYHSKQPHAVPISRMRRVSFNYSNCAAIPQFTGKCHETALERRLGNLFLFWASFAKQLQLPIYWVNTFCANCNQTSCLLAQKKWCIVCRNKLSSVLFQDSGIWKL